MKTKISNSTRLELIDLSVQNAVTGRKETYLVIVQPGETEDETFQREVLAGKYWMSPTIYKSDVIISSDPKTNRLIAVDFKNSLYYSYARRMAL
jgi:hypothetical protein